MKQSVAPNQGLIGMLNKGLGALVRPMRAEEVVRLGWNLLQEDLSLPTAVLYRERLQHNLNWMQHFIEAYGMRLAPHGKTTMAPRLFQMQLEGGAWGITVATAHQATVAHAHGAHRVLMANQLVGKRNMQMIASLIDDPDFTFYCLVDSPENVDQLGAFFHNEGLRLNVLLELGIMGGRCGVRDDGQIEGVLGALNRWRGVVDLCGVELYEGILKDEENIRTFLRRACEVTKWLAAEGLLKKPALISGAGSAWYDVVAEEFHAAGFGDTVEIVLRPGCYLTHDVGAYEAQQNRILKSNSVARQMHSGLVPALHVWTYVQSIPEPELAVVQMGRRDAAFDSGLPVPALHFRRGDVEPKRTPAHWEVTKLMDQHGYLKIAKQDDVRVGDMVGFNISHPCLTFDKWRVLPIVDEKYNVVDVVQTYF